MADWQVGDLALCVLCRKEDFPEHPNWVRGESYLRNRAYYVVEGVLNHFGQIGLVVSARSPHPTGAWDHRQFRKITPGAKIEGVEVERRVPTPKRVKQDA